MPIIAIAGAALAGIGSAVAGAAAAVGGAVSAGVAAVGGVMGVMEISAATGAVLNVVGDVTHDKGLQTAGMVLGGIGAVGSLAGAAGLDLGPGLFGTTADIAAGGSGTSAGAGVTQVADAADSADMGIPSDVVGAASNEFVPPSPPTDISSPGAVPSDAGPSAGAVPSDAATESANYGSGLLNSPVANSGASTTPMSPSATPPVSSATSPAATDANATPPGFFSKLLNNNLAQYGMVQAAGALVSGAFNQLTPAQVAAYDAQAANNRAAAALTAKQTQNMSGPMPAANLGPPKLAPVSGAPAGSGLINAPVTGSVTGAPANA